MSLRISACNPLTKDYLIVRSDGVEYCEMSTYRGPRHFRFTDIECVLLSSDHKLSFQVGDEVFSIPTKPDDAAHQTVIASLVQEVKRAGAGWADSVS